MITIGKEIKHKIINEEGIKNTFIITCCDDSLIEKCINTLVNTIDREKHKIIFIEGPSVEARPLMYEIVKDHVDVYIRTETNLGFSASCNLGMALVRTPFFTIVHDDVWFPHKGWWDEVRDRLDSDEEMLMLQPCQPFRRVENPPEDVNEEEYQSILKTKASTASLAEIYCPVFKKEWIDLIGFFDEGIYPVGPEDMEWYRLALSIEKRTAVTNAAWVFHKGVGRADAKHGGPRNDRAKSINFVEKWGGDPNSKQVYAGLTSGNKIKPILPNQLRQL